KIIKSGLICSGIDKVARDIIAEAGFGENFGHGLGHSVGVEIHEEPRFSPKCDTIIQEGVVMTVEPGIYLEGKFGCRIEDMVVVTKDGCEIITKSPKELIII
ncbi:MAG: M24 family metallopeptidase, partial [Oscillospiraceae bacterium]